MYVPLKFELEYDKAPQCTVNNAEDEQTFDGNSFGISVGILNLEKSER